MVPAAYPGGEFWHNHLGTVLRELGDLAGARTKYERALEIGQAILGADHPSLAIFPPQPRHCPAAAWRWVAETQLRQFAECRPM
jgi:hypothetical protein